MRLVKLVRDRVALTVGKQKVIYQPLPAQEFRLALRTKLVEEAIEYITSDDENRLSELADLFEVIYALAKHDLQVEFQEVVDYADSKSEKYGAFDWGVGLYVGKESE